VTADVPADALVISRVPQVIKLEGAKRKRRGSKGRGSGSEPAPT
jgi:bifunctional N-acetylglucosamine-1-phosphate-uridyltransferase/glucosamine-1-phosphate-acetyltransferase GlmU-like protein